MDFKASASLSNTNEAKSQSKPLLLRALVPSIIPPSTLGQRGRPGTSDATDQSGVYNAYFSFRPDEPRPQDWHPGRIW